MRKLGIRSGMRILLRDAPGPYDALVPGIPSDVQVADDPGGAEDGNGRDGRDEGDGHDEVPVDFVHLFVRSRAGLGATLATLKARIRPDGMIWVSWPKRASKVPTDVTEDVIREAALGAGLVDVKVCAVDEIWSGLKLVIRRKDRG